MRRLHLVTIAAAMLLTACPKTGEGGRTKAGSPDAPHAAAGAGTNADGADAGDSSERAAIGPGASRSLVAVASTSASEAEPCERVCGRLGDCLLDGDDMDDHIAGGLELECLDMCVHSPTEAEARVAFLDCARESSCGGLRGCAERSWDGLREARRSPEIEGIVATNDPCKSGCRWLFACIYTGAPPGDAPMDPTMEQQMNMCMDECDGDRPDREIIIHLNECLPNNCTIDSAYRCWEGY